MLEKENQRVGRLKSTQINKAYIESGEYRRKFDLITDNAELNKLMYELAKRMLYHRTGTLYEDMYWIDAESVEIVASETNNKVEEKVLYSTKTRRVIRRYRSDGVLITLHTHPNSFPPSIEDLNANYLYGYNAGLVICHDGTLYYYNSNERINSRYFEMKVADYMARGYNEVEAQKRALDELKKQFDISFREVCLYDNGR